MHSTTVRRIGFALLAIGLLMTALSIYSGLIRFYLVLIIPVLTSDNALGALSLLAIFAGIILIIIGPVFSEEGQDEYRAEEMDDAQRASGGRAKVGGVVLIGPIPIVFGSDKKMALIAAAIAIMMLAIVVVLLL